MSRIYVMRVGVSLFDEDDELYEEDIDIMVHADSLESAREQAYDEVEQSYQYADICGIEEIKEVT